MTLKMLILVISLAYVIGEIIVIVRFVLFLGVEEILGTVEGVAHPHEVTMETDILPKEAPPPPPPLSEKDKGEHLLFMYK